MPFLPAGLRVYAIGDIHGRLDLLQQLREKITADAATSKAKIQIIFLGDYIDRGVYSRQLIDYLINWKNEATPPPIFLLGNHELVMRQILERGDETLLEDWLQFGGMETLLSYGVRPVGADAKSSAIIKSLQEKTPEPHRDFLSSLQPSVSFGDYFFCHAGVEPDVSLEEQPLESLVWIRKRFLEYKGRHDKMIVHGHSVSLKAEFRLNRIGIDTGAYATGKLTALGLEGDNQWLLQTG